MSQIQVEQTYPPIFWVEIYLNTNVHIIGHGFTSYFSKYCCASSKEEAEAVMMKWAGEKGCHVKKVSARKAVIQDLQTYSHVDRIINLPDEALQAEYDRRQYPVDYRVAGEKVRLEACHA
jgi:hypothetical protein